MLHPTRATLFTLLLTLILTLLNYLSVVERRLLIFLFIHFGHTCGAVLPSHRLAVRAFARTQTSPEWQWERGLQRVRKATLTSLPQVNAEG